MELHDKYIATRMPRDSAMSVFMSVRAETETTEPELLIGGLVVGETAGVGLWVEVDLLMGVDTQKPYTIPTRTRLIRWHLIENAQIYEQKPPMAEMGFRLR